MNETVFTSLEAVWQHCPVTALSFISKSLLAIGSANVLGIYSVDHGLVLCKYLLKRFVTIHRVETVADVKQDKFILCLCGNRFVTVLEFKATSATLTLITEDYRCDNMIYCTVHFSPLAFCLQTLSSHGVLKIMKSSCGHIAGISDLNNSTSLQLETSVCYTGHIFQFTSKSLSTGGKTLVFCGSTFGKIHVYHISNDDLSQCSSAPTLTLCAQKPLIILLWHRIA
uniref:Uncharacterized protein n=1 Tax=Trichobilharzia regenti TaxID=157069 RepID=A0AA85KEX0_TRIRE|nr:unnamed protein product [Trichobilharzia regenti]